jgi:hypothetical protein
MDEKPVAAEPVKPGRRWYQFGLRTLLIAMALLAIPMGYIGWQAKIVRERYRMTHDRGGRFSSIALCCPDLSNQLPLVRRLIGDRWYDTIGFEESTPQEIVDRYTAIFPEAKVERSADTMAFLRRLANDGGPPLEY